MNTATATCKPVAAAIVAMFATIGIPFRAATDGPAADLDSLNRIQDVVNSLLEALFAGDMFRLDDRLTHLRNHYTMVDQDAAFEIDRSVLARVQSITGGTAPAADSKPIYMTIGTLRRMLTPFEKANHVYDAV